MNNKGFTLIELLVSIALIAMITLIITPIVTNTVKQNKIDSCKSIFDSIEAASESFVSDNRYDLNFSSGYTIKASDLKTKGYLTGTLENPVDKNSLEDIEVTITYNSSTKSFNYSLSPLEDDVCK